MRNDGLTHKGVAAEIGVLFTKGRLSVSASTLTIGGSQCRDVWALAYALERIA